MVSEKNVVLTGASGHIGFHVALNLIDRGFKVLLLVRSENSNIALLKEKGAKVQVADLLQPETYAQALVDIECLFHLASENTTSLENEEQTIQSTFDITRLVLDTALSQEVKTIIYTSSVVVLGRAPNMHDLINEDSVYHNPSTPYIKGKFYAEKYVDELVANKNADIRRLYPSWVIGPNNVKITPPQQTVNDYMLKGQKFYFKGGISVAGVSQVAQAHVNAWLKGSHAEKYVLGGKNVTFKEFYSLLAAYSNHKKPFMFLPKWFIYLLSCIGKIIFGAKFKIQPSYVKEVIGKYSWYDSSKAMRQLDYKLHDAEEVIQTAVKESVAGRLLLNQLYNKHIPGLKRIAYNPDDILLVTGFPGWLGNRMVDIFINGDKFCELAVDRKVRLLVQPHFKGIINNLPANFEIAYCDLSDKASLVTALNGVKAVYHLAGVIYPPKIKTFYQVNVNGTINLVDACIEAGVRRVIFMGTDSICGYGRGKRVFDSQEPAHPYKNYGKSKYLAEKYILDKSAEGLIDGTSLRGFWFFGPFMPARNMDFFKMFKWKKQIVFGDGKNLRSISHTDNTIQAFILAEKNTATFGKWYWIGGNKADYTVDEIYRQISDGLGVKYSPLYVPKLFCELFGALDTFLGYFGILNPTIHAAGKFHKDIAGDITAAKTDFNYQPKVDFEHIKTEIKEALQ